MDGMVDDGDNPDIKPIPLSESTVLESSGGGGGDGPQNGATPVSIVHVTIPRRLSQMQVQSVIQPNQQSVIQTTAGLQTVQLATGVKGGNVILLNKGGGSVIHTPGGHSAINVVEAGGGDDGLSEDEAAKKRREILARRPSYRKILNDLGVDKGGDSPSASESGQESETVTISSSGSVIGGQHYQSGGLLKVIPASAIQLTSSNSSQSDGLQTLMTTGSTGGAIVHYAQGQDGQFFVPGSHLNDTLTVSGGDLQGYRIQAVTTNTGSLGQSLVVASSQGEHIVEEASRKREIRLLKNREAARECRRKKKEYIKCLENRVAVLENQNKALIEELKSLKDLYCSQKAD